MSTLERSHKTLAAVKDYAETITRDSFPRPTVRQNTPPFNDYIIEYKFADTWLPVGDPSDGRFTLIWVDFEKKEIAFRLEQEEAVEILKSLERC